MITNCFHFTGKNLHKSKFIFGLFITCCAIAVAADSQAQAKNPGYGTRTETVEHANINLLPKKAQELSLQYQRSIIASNKDLYARNLIPFYPYNNINLDTKFLPAAPFRVYLGKLSAGSVKDYILIIVPCKENDSIKKFKTKTVYRYLDLNSATIPGAPNGATWISIKVDSVKKTQDRVTYQQVVKRTAINYIANFKIFIRNQGLVNRYPTCIVYEGRRTGGKTDTKRLRLQPVLRPQSTGTNSVSGGSRSVHRLKRFMFADRYTLKDADEGASICCEAPPENGNQMND